MTTRAQGGGTRARRASTPRHAATAPPARSAEPGSRRDHDPDVLAALEEQREFLLASLDDLERERAAGDVDGVDYESLRDDYTARAAATIKAIDERRTALAAEGPPRRWGVWVAVVAAVALIGIGAGWVVAVSSGQRAPGDTLSGDIRRSTIDELARASSSIAAATAAQQAGDTDAALSAYQSALEAYATVLEQQPNNTEALTYRGWLYHVLALQTGDEVARRLDADALESLSRAIDVDPDYADARIFRAIVLDGLRRPAEAAADLETVDPARVPQGMRGLVDELRARVQSGG